MTEDTCAATMLTDTAGKLLTNSKRLRLSTPLSPGDTVSYQCPSSAARGVTRSYCESLLGTMETVMGGGGLVQVPEYKASLRTKTKANSYDLCVTGPAFAACNTYPFSAANRSGIRSSVVECLPDQGAGQYQISWRINGAFLGQSLSYHAPSGVPTDVTPFCSSVPVSRQGFPAGLTHSQSSVHFVIHYDDNPADPNSITDPQAANVLRSAEQALSYETTTLGMPTYVTPASYLGSGDQVDIYIANERYLSDVHVWPPAGQTQAPPLGFPSSAYIVQSSLDRGAIGLSVFLVLEDATGARGRVGPDPGLLDSTSVWAGERFASGSAVLNQIVPMLSQPLDCVPICRGVALEAGWRFYQYLAELYGPTVVHSVLSAEAQLLRSGTGSQMDDALGQVLSADGSSLASALAEYAFEDVSGSWQPRWMQNLAYGDIASSTTQPISPGGPFSANPVSVNHLASHVLTLRAAADTQAPCGSDQLTLEASVPAGGLYPGLTLTSGGKTSQVRNADPAQSAVTQTVSFGSCAGATVRMVFTNGTLEDNMTFQLTGELTPG